MIEVLFWKINPIYFGEDAFCNAFRGPTIPFLRMLLCCGLKEELRHPHELGKREIRLVIPLICRGL
jgi:hypothetical protein